MKILSVETRIHGRVLLREAAEPGAVIIGFHGYMEHADIQMERLASMPDSDRWTLVSAQGLHRFYRGRSEEVVASWMTRQDREDMILDNVEYFDRIVASVAAPETRIVTIGFSQGVAMAFRGAVRGRRRASGIVAVGGDVPPELLADPSLTFPPTLITRGTRDEWYTDGKLEADAAALRARGSSVQPLVFDAGHEWTAEVSMAAGRFIGQCTAAPG
ncbi:MAG TPA: dienelactone hydrolase family protein [Vicinamibacterales bacterium]|nr:dienelactone hydrolase family protein [Vicinamibacterales bacterium]